MKVGESEMKGRYEETEKGKGEVGKRKRERRGKKGLSEARG